jgi:hypothetical protein
MTDSLSQPTHEISHILLVKDQHFLILKPLKEGAVEVVLRIDEMLASHLIGLEDVEVRKAN